MAWRAGQRVLNPLRLICVDGRAPQAINGAATNMARRYGRSPRGQRLNGSILHGHGKSTTFVGGFTRRGFVAPSVIDGAMNGTVFRAWIEQMLAPKLTPGNIVVMHDLAAHKVAGVRQCSAARPPWRLRSPAGL